MIRQLAQRFLEQPELTQFHFQRHFMAPFLQIFEKQQILQAREYLLENVEGLIRDSAPRIQSGWSVIFELLAIAIADPATQRGTFRVVALLVNECLDVLTNNLADVLALLSAFVQRADVELREAAVGCFVKIASKLTKDQVTDWFILFEALARAAQNDVDSVRRMGHAAMLQITADIGAIGGEVIKNAFDEALPQFFAAANLAETDPAYFVSAADFQEKLFVRLIDPNWERLAQFFAQAIDIIANNVMRQNDEFTKASIKVLWAFVTPKYRALGEEQHQVLFGQLLRIAQRLPSFSIGNGQDFLRGLSALQLESVDEKRFLEVFKAATVACAEKRSYILWAAARSTMFQVMLRYGDGIADEIAGCLEQTIRVFLSTQFPYDTTSVEAIAWNQAIVVSMNGLNAMMKPLFDICFNAACDGLLDMINATNIEVRKQINVAMQKILL
jgi:brefeldin A-inhibited guanine nucleotide-exchange protein